MEHHAEHVLKSVSFIVHMHSYSKNLIFLFYVWTGQGGQLELSWIMCILEV